MQSKDAIDHHVRQKQRRRQGHSRRLFPRYRIGGKRRYTNNAQGRLSRLDTPEGSWHYTYNLDGQRLKKQGPSGTTWYHYGPQGELLAELDSAKQPIREYLYLDGQRLAMVVHGKQGSAVQSVAVSGESTSHITLSDTASSHHLFTGIPTMGDGAGIVQVQKAGSEAHIRFQSWGDSDSSTRHLPLLALPAGRHTMADGSIWEVGEVTIGQTNAWQKVNLAEAMPGIPSVFVTLQGTDVEPSITARLTHITNGSFQVALQEEGERQAGASATVSYLAIYSPAGQGTVMIDGESLSYQLTQANLINTGPKERKEAVLKKMLPPQNMTILALAIEEGINPVCITIPDGLCFLCSDLKAILFTIKDRSLGRFELGGF